MTELIFEPFPKLQRLNGPVIITEKLDGTNACIIIDSNGNIAAQSRTKLITPDKDNFGFAKWVYDNQTALVTALGEGRHYGEWFGAGIQRNYGLTKKLFALFNTSRWNNTTFMDTNLALTVVPVLFTGTFPDALTLLPDIMLSLKTFGSQCVLGFMNPEGVVLYDTRSGQGYKKTFDYDDSGKGGQKDENGNVI